MDFIMQKSCNITSYFEKIKNNQISVA